MKTLLLWIVPALLAAPVIADEKADPWHQWIERDFPFFSAAVDASHPGTRDNLTPRGIVFHFGDTYLCWDVDLLRVATIWTADGPPFDNAAMAPGSYPDTDRRAPMGQDGLPRPRGQWVRNGLYPGVAIGAPTFVDPRPGHPEAPDEVGRGGLPPEIASFRRIRYAHGGTLEYSVGPGDGVGITEWFEADSNGISRVITVQPHDAKLSIVLCEAGPQVEIAFEGEKSGGAIVDHKGRRVLELLPATVPRRIRVTYRRALSAPPDHADHAGRHWPQHVERPIPPFEPNDQVLQLETIPLPSDNPWKRTVRAAGIAFLSDGRIVLVTFDGDVWIGEGLVADARSIAWRRFAAGLHEPLSVGVHDNSIYVFDRNGIWRLCDTDDDGEADVHELVCSQLDQTAETREFASDMQIARDGSFIICKPGQNHSTVGRSSGAVLRISPDGRQITRLAYGLRQPFLGLDAKTGRIAVTDQEGNYVPTTPVHLVQPGEFYGFMGKPGPYPQTIAPPMAWIPHSVCASAATVHWPHGPKLGPLDGACVLLAYNSPGMLRVFEDDADGVQQGGAARLPVDFDFAPLKAAMNPADGMFYITGFRLYATVAKDLSALARLRVNAGQTWPLPTKVIATKRGIYLAFAHELDGATVTDLHRFEISRWNYQRSPEYGSPHFRLDGSKGQDQLPIASVKLSRDRRAVFIGVPNMLAAMQIGVHYDLRTLHGGTLQHDLYLTAHKLREIDLATHGFSDNDVDLSGGAVHAKAERVSVEAGRKLYTSFGCAACHSLDGTTKGKVGPSWKALFGSERKLLHSGRTVVADETYLRESILTPGAKVAEGAVNGEAGMPAYEGVLSDAQIKSIILLIKSLQHEE